MCAVASASELEVEETAAISQAHGRFPRYNSIPKYGAEQKQSSASFAVHSAHQSRDQCSIVLIASWSQVCTGALQRSAHFIIQ